MSAAHDALVAELRDFNVAGDPSSGAYEPAKAGIRDAFLAVLDAAEAASDVATEVAGTISDTAQTVLDQVGGVAAILTGSLYLESYGIVKNDPTAGAANATRMAALFADVEATGKEVAVTSGDIYLTGQVAATFSKKLRLDGRGRDATRFIWTAGIGGAGQAGGFKFTYTNIHRPPDIRGMSLETASVTSGAGRALDISVAPQTLIPGKGPRIEDIRIRGSDETYYLGFWNDGLYMEELWYPEIKGLEFNGRNGIAIPFASSSGIRLKNVQAPTIEDCLMFWAENGILLEGPQWSEGIYIHSGEIVGVDIGINDQSTFARSGISVHDMHINAFTYGMITQFRSDLSFHDNLIFKTSQSTANWAALQISSAERLNFHSNRISCPGCTPTSGNANGVILGGGSNHFIKDNHFFGWGGQSGACVVGVGGTDYNCITGNSRYDGGPASIASGTGANTLITGNLPDNS